MYLADLEHPSKVLQDKLTRLYNLRPGKEIELGFRPDFLTLLEAYGNPQDHLPPTIHVAGTNGKGSIIATLRALLEAAGHSVSAFTSPHLLQFNERLYANGAMISNEDLDAAIDKALMLNHSREVSFFEITTAMAFDYFTQAQSDFCLLEVGMGGRLDCTNIIAKPAVSVIGNISYDHQQYLGDSITEITSEKAGIIKPGVPCVIAPQTEDVMDVFIQKAAEMSAPLFLPGRDWDARETSDGMRLRIGDQSFDLPRPGLLGPHQIGNAAAALTALHAMGVWNESAYQTGVQNIHWPGRLQQLQSGTVEIWYDGGCNSSAAAALATQIQTWQKEAPKDLHLIVGMKGDKDSDGFLNLLFPLAKSCFIVPIEKISKTLTRAEVSAPETLPLAASPSIAAALENITNTPGPKRILIAGSLYLAADALQLARV